MPTIYFPPLMVPVLSLLFLCLTCYSYDFSNYNLSSIRRDTYVFVFFLFCAIWTPNSDDPYSVVVPENNGILVFNVYEIITSYGIGSLSEDQDCQAAIYTLALTCQSINASETTTFADDGQSFVAYCL